MCEESVVGKYQVGSRNHEGQSGSSLWKVMGEERKGALESDYAG